jgi:hypothetical protein
VTDATGHELFKVSRVRMFLPQELGDHSDSEAFAQARSGRTFFRWGLFCQGIRTLYDHRHPD